MTAGDRPLRQIARGFSLARISLPCGVAVLCFFFSFFALLTWCEALFVGEAFKESEGGAQKMGARPF